MDYDTICKAKFMTHFNFLVFIKAYTHYETNSKLLLDNVNIKQIQDLTAYKFAVENFLFHINTELDNLKKLPFSYLETKFSVLLQRVYNTMKDQEGHPLSEKMTFPSLIGDKETDGFVTGITNLQSTLQVLKLDLGYLRDAKGQLVNHIKESSFSPALKYFVDQLPTALEDILRYVVANYQSAPKDSLTYLIDFFNVFGDLVGENKYHDILLKFFTEHLNLKPNFKDESHPLLLREPELFNLPSINAIKHKNILKIDRTFYNPHIELADIEVVVDTHMPAYTYHPNWLRFFNYESREVPIKQNTPNRNDVIKEGMKNIYYVYVQARQESLIPLADDNEEGKIADTLYNYIINTHCYENKQDPCPLADLIPEKVFASNYIVMLTLLKQFTTKKGQFEKDEIDKMAVLSTKLGVANAHKNIENLDIDLKDFKEKSAATRLNTLEEGLNEMLQSLKQANRDPKEPGRKVREQIQDNSEKFTKAFEQLYPELGQLEEDDTKIQDYVDVLDVILDKVDQKEDEFANILTDIVNDKVADIETKFTDLDDPVMQDRKKRIDNIHTKVTKWAVNHIQKKFEISIYNPFVRYLDYTITNAVILRANVVGGDFFKYQVHREIRQKDIYLFYYLPKIAAAKGNAQAIEAIRNDLEKIEGINIEQMEKDFYFHRYRPSFEFMTHFFNLFAFFESQHVNLQDKESNFGTEYVQTFNKLYKFLIDLRINNDYHIKDPVDFAHEQLLKCMAATRDHIFSGKKMPETNMEDYVDDETLEDFEQDDERATYKKEFAPCKSNYSSMAGFYYFLLLEAYPDRPQVLTRHREYFASTVPVRSDDLYEYLAFSKNDLQNRFGKYCQASSDSICIGEEMYRKLKDFLVEAEATSTPLETIINEKIYTTYTMTREGESVSPAVFWNVMNRLNLLLPKVRSQQQARALFTITSVPSTSSPSGKYTLFGLVTENKGLLAQYLALRFVKKSSSSNIYDKIATGVTYLLESYSGIDNVLRASANLRASPVKFMLNYCSSLVQVEKITNIIITASNIGDFFLWTNDRIKIEGDDLVNISRKEDPKDIGSAIAIVLKFQQYNKSTGAKRGILNTRKKINDKRAPATKEKVAATVITETVAGFSLTEESQTIEDGIMEDEMLQDLKNKAVAIPGQITILITSKGATRAENIKNNLDIVKLTNESHLRRLRLLRRVLV